MRHPTKKQGVRWYCHLPWLPQPLHLQSSIVSRLQVLLVDIRNFLPRIVQFLLLCFTLCSHPGFDLCRCLCRHIEFRLWFHYDHLLGFNFGRHGYVSFTKNPCFNPSPPYMIPTLHRIRKLTSMSSLTFRITPHSK